RRRGWERALALGALGMLGHLLAHNLVDNLYVHGMYLLVALVLGLVSGMDFGGRASADVECGGHASADKDGVL
ncbi:MAG: hypothetical protein V1772_06895, partial [Chloroflexota bacterium]